ncbi:MAG: hypothetical protein AAF539_10320 [Planctomycetota bacterium]
MPQPRTWFRIISLGVLAACLVGCEPEQTTVTDGMSEDDFAKYDAMLNELDNKEEEVAR